MHTVRIFERTGQIAKLYCRTEQVEPLAAIRAALEVAGVEFTTVRMPGSREHTPSVRLRKPAGAE